MTRLQPWDKWYDEYQALVQFAAYSDGISAKALYDEVLADYWCCFGEEPPEELRILFHKWAIEHAAISQEFHLVKENT